MLILFQQATGSYFGELLFCVLWKITFHHPIIILRLEPQYLSNRSSFVFAKVEYLDTIFHYKPPGKINNRLFSN